MLKNKFLLLISTAILTTVNAPQIINNGFITAYAATQKAHLYFYDIDGKKITSLTQKLKYENGRIYTSDDENFKMPDPNDKTNVEKFNTDIITVNAIGWLDADTGKRYKAGDKFTFTEGDHHLYVRTDSPQVTNEDSIVANEEELVHVVFHNRNGEEIEVLQKDVPQGTKITMPDPDKYDDWDTSENKEGESFDSEEGKGIKWYCETEKGKYLYDKDTEIEFGKIDTYDFYIRTDKPVEISFFYPFGTEDDDEDEGDLTYFASTKHNAGELYKTVTAKVGDKIETPKSFGAVVWNGTFKGWKYTSDEGDDTIYKKNEKITIYDNNSMDIFAYYQYDENWDINAPNENGDDDNAVKGGDTGRLSNFNAESMSQKGGSGFNVNIVTTDEKDENGNVIASKQTAVIVGGKDRVNKDVSVNGIKGRIKENTNLNSSIKDPKGDKNDPANYKLDKYGNKVEESQFEDIGINEVLRQDDSAMYMDFYGNSFVYYPALSREDNMKLAQERLTAGKTASFAENIKNWDIEMVNRFEAIEYALLLGKYPSQGQVLMKDINGNPEVTWDESYMNKQAFNKLLNYRKTWNGWYDIYDDGLYEKYKGTSSNNTVVSIISPELLNQMQSKQSDKPKNLLDYLMQPFVKTVYASDDGTKNNIGIAHQVRGRILESFDLKNSELEPIYFQLIKGGGKAGKQYVTYDFSGLASELDSTQTANLTKIYRKLVNSGISEEAASGICANIWDTSRFDATYNNGDAIGILGWTGKRADELKKAAEDDKRAEKNKKISEKWQDINVQIDFLVDEISSRKKMLNSALKEYTGEKDFKTVKDSKVAADIWYICMMESTSDESCTDDSVTVGDKKWPALTEIRTKTDKIINAKVKKFTSGGLNGLSNEELISSIIPEIYNYDLTGDPVVIEDSITFALTKIGLNYSQGMREGGCGGTYYDCSSYVHHAYLYAGYDLGGTGSTSPTAAAECEWLEQRGKLICTSFDDSLVQPGDIVFYGHGNNGRYKEVHHVALYIGDGRIAHAASTKSGIIISDVLYSNNSGIVSICRPT